MKPRRHDSPVAPIDPASGSLFERLLQMLEEKVPLHLNFEDLTGVTMDVPDLRLRQPYRIHTCDYCMLAKANVAGHQDCIRNKMAANRVALQRRRSFMGQCHLGVSDLVRPLIYHDQVLGVFYYGSFVAEGSEDLARARIHKYCRRRRMDPLPYLVALKRLPRLTPEAVAKAWQNLDLAAALAERILEGFGLLGKRYRTRRGAQFMVWNGAMPAVVACAVRYINQNYGNVIRLNEIARLQRCHPDYLSRVFKQTIGIGIGEYVNRLRVDHARRLLGSEKFSLGEIGFMVGFYDQSHFGKVFREYVGMTPNEYRGASVVKRTAAKPLEISYFDYSNLREFNPKLGLVVKPKVFAERLPRPLPRKARAS